MGLTLGNMGVYEMMGVLSLSVNDSWDPGWDTLPTSSSHLSHTRPGKRLHNYGKSPRSMGKSTTNDHFQ